jgi:hypothetical protein
MKLILSAATLLAISGLTTANTYKTACGLQSAWSFKCGTDVFVCNVPVNDVGKYHEEFEMCSNHGSTKLGTFADRASQCAVLIDFVLAVDAVNGNYVDMNIVKAGKEIYKCPNNRAISNFACYDPLPESPNSIPKWETDEKSMEQCQADPYVISHPTEETDPIVSEPLVVEEPPLPEPESVVEPLPEPESTDPIVSETVVIEPLVVEEPPLPEPECIMDYTVGSSGTVCGTGANVVTLEGTVGIFDQKPYQHGEGVIYGISFDSTKGTVTFDVANPFGADAQTDIYVKYETGSSVQGYLEPTCAAMPDEAVCVEPTDVNKIEAYCRDAGYAIVYVYFATTDVLVTTGTAIINDCCYPADVASFDYSSGGNVIELAYKIDCSCPEAVSGRKLLIGN